jgi:hypothetical protein
MRRLISILAGGALLVWTLLCWLAYGLGDVIEDWLSAHAGWIAGDTVLASLVHAMLNAGQGLGLIFIVIIWLIGAGVILAPALLLRRLLRKRAPAEPVTPVQIYRSEAQYRPRHSAEHAGKGNMIGRVMDAARKYR